MSEALKNILIGVVIGVIVTAVGSYFGYILVIKENQVKIQNLDKVWGSLKSITESQSLTDKLVERLTAEYNSTNKTLEDTRSTLNETRSTLNETQKSLRAVMLAIVDKVPDIDYNHFLSLSSIMKNYSINQSIAVAKEIKKKDMIINNLNNYSYKDRSEMASAFIIEMNGIGLEPIDSVNIASSLFDVEMFTGGVGGSEEVTNPPIKNNKDKKGKENR